MRILICEDEEIMLTALEFRLRKQGFEVVKTQNGQQAIDLLSQNMNNIQLVVADLMMPFVTGMELIAFIRTYLNSDIPIIAISAMEQDEVVLEAFRKGANDFITKPFRPNELILRIKKIAQDIGIEA